ncbi:hypothetical protein EHQ43_01540 [Leptospira bouyouniensis]|uniref:SMP-30/Gluconolactonase/LRE-like region domain-containing protein n=1 Tax=Leptospira bouyouniensis TaxID=2484911 RepID=A0A7I0HWV1_9LEPT|nr:NHL repeat-containing protein [Leptospira bouyouniensis]TGL09166.1 hypothetical protein EHQ43_01540 [Leptospira bouyouniensis]
MTNKILTTLLLLFFISNCKTKDSNDDLTTFLFLQLATQPTSTAVVSTFAGQASSGLVDATGTAAKFKQPNGIAFDSAGNMYVADTGNHCIRKITSAGVVTVFAGSDTGVSGLTNATGTAARFNEPFGVAVDSAGNVYVGDSLNMVIRKITSAGVVTTLAGGGGGMGAVDGTGGAAKFDQPLGLAIDTAGNIYVADGQNDAIRKVTSAGVVTTIAGSTTSVSGFVDGTGTSARFTRPSGIAVDSAGNLYIGDTNNNAIRKITSAGVVTTLAGSPSGISGYVNGVSTIARFTQPIGITLDSSGNLYVSDSTNSAIRKVTSDGVVTSIAGATTRISGFVDGIGFNTRFNQPYGIATDSNGHLFVGDYGNNAIRKIVP